MKVCPGGVHTLAASLVAEFIPGSLAKNFTMFLMSLMKYLNISCITRIPQNNHYGVYCMRIENGDKKAMLSKWLPIFTVSQNHRLLDTPIAHVCLAEFLTHLSSNA